jgi:hypothetical protein
VDEDDLDFGERLRRRATDALADIRRRVEPLLGALIAAGTA